MAIIAGIKDLKHTKERQIRIEMTECEWILDDGFISQLFGHFLVVVVFRVCLLYLDCLYGWTNDNKNEMPILLAMTVNGSYSVVNFHLMVAQIEWHSTDRLYV